MCVRECVYMFTSVCVCVHVCVCVRACVLCTHTHYTHCKTSNFSSNYMVKTGGKMCLTDF